MPTTTAAGDLRYPVGRFSFPDAATQQQIAGWIDDIARAPEALRAAVHGLSDTQVDTPYRTGGWTVRQLVHHVADSHMQAYARVKLALTEERPTIKPYDEAAWANLDDTFTVPIAVSLDLLEALHIRWVALIRSITPEQMRREFVHPERNRSMSLSDALAMYAWHGRHHVAHVTALRERERW